MIEGRTIRDFDYAHMSSIAYSSKRYRWLIVLGIVLMIAGVWVGGFFIGAVALAIIGLILIFAGVKAKSEWVEVNVVGVSNPIRFLGSRQDLDSLLQIIRQRRMAKDTVVQTETKGD